MYDINWFQDKIVPLLQKTQFEYRFFANGDFGSLDRVEFKSGKLGGEIDFWGLGWLGIFIWDYEKEKVLFNVLLEQNENTKKEKAFEELQKFLE